MGEKEQTTAGGLHFVGRREELVEATRSFRTLEGRDIVVIHHDGGLYCLDAYCYHAAGLLWTGDIEELGGKLCIICPKHKYKITLAEGECIYKGPDRTKDTPEPRWYTKGVKQRTHQVTETDGDVYVTLSTDPDWLESDLYQGEKGKEERAKVEAAVI